MSSDGDKIIYQSDADRLVYIYDATTGTTTAPFPDDLGSWPVISGDGTTVAMEYFPPNTDPIGNTGIVVKRLGTGRPTAADYVMLPPAPDYAVPIKLSRDGKALAYQYCSATWNRQGACALQTWTANSGYHHAGGAYNTYPLSADIDDDDSGLLYTLYKLAPPVNEPVPGVWYDLLI
jgi:hypothetical protein